MAYMLVQLDETGGNTLAVVHQNWLTPLKKEVFWPPYKTSKQYKKSLLEGEVVNENSWMLYSIQRVFLTTDELSKAFEKEREAELTSDLASASECEAINESPLRPKRNRRPRKLDSDSEDESQFVRPQKIQLKKLSGAVEIRDISGVAGHKPLEATENKSRTLVQDQLWNLNPSTSTPTSDVQDDQIGFRTVLSTLAYIKEQNRTILNKLNELSQPRHAEKCVDIHTKLSVKLPLDSTRDLITFEEYLEVERNFDDIGYFSMLGGKDVKQKTNKILKELLTDELASCYSYFGKRDKQPLVKTKLKDLLFKSIQIKNNNITCQEIETHVKEWLKQAPQRKKRKKSI
ncbi:uncharacterized protein LOC126888132 isoform X2 [Diabrotica virgifera virgifera]|uniref:DUF4806 domain-containing protein n=1 Tax=Diabrotica virgifera virgifera TaxID=50390 RepID=A0ABM5KPI7_DIAVI|nr:uncharacterized protein LOC126888132 isoform X2 [Diabrotica virgifera virgifera]